MLTVEALMAKARANAGIPSNYRLARVLGTTDNTVARWKAGQALPNDEMALKLAELADLPPGKVLAAVHAQREPEGSPLRSAWASLCIMSTSLRRPRPAVAGLRV